MERTNSGLLVPGPNPVLLDFHEGRLSYYGRTLVRKADPQGIHPSARWLMGLTNMASFSNYAENKTLDHAMGKASWTMPATVALALCTVVPTDSSTGESITEANYTGYARKVIAASALGSAASGEIKTSEALTFAECTSGSSTIIGYAVCDSSSKGAGNIIAWGTVTSTVISTTQTPATVASGGLVVTAD